MAHYRAVLSNGDVVKSRPHWKGVPYTHAWEAKVELGHLNHVHEPAGTIMHAHGFAASEELARATARDKFAWARKKPRGNFKPGWTPPPLDTYGVHPAEFVADADAQEKAA